MTLTDLTSRTTLDLSDPITKPLRWILDRLHEQGHLSYGWTIVVLTILVRLAIVPLAVKQLRSMRKMQAFSPQIKALQQKHAGDKRKQQEELMTFYKVNGINPFSSCLPMLPQMPIFIGLYFVLKDIGQDLDRTSLSFMGIIPDITSDVRELGWRAAILLVIYGTSQLLSFEVNAQPSTPKMQRWLMRLIPIPIVLGVLIYPHITAGLVLYWVTTNLWTCGQQLVIKQKLGFGNIEAEQAAAALAAGSRTPGKPTVEPAPKPEQKRVASASLVDEGGSPNGSGRSAGRRKPRSAPPGSSTDSATEAPAETQPATNPPARKTPKGGGGPGSRRRPPKKKGSM